jgi:hypothetical protein
MRCTMAAAAGCEEEEELLQDEKKGQVPSPLSKYVRPYVRTYRYYGVAKLPTS